MNSISRNYNKDASVFLENDASDNRCICPTNCLFLQCGKPKSTIIQLPIVPVTIVPPITVDTIEVDTSCIDDAKIKIDFTININNGMGGITSNLTFNIFKLCKHDLGRIPLVPKWSYTISVSPESIKLFTFFVYDCYTFRSKECTYILQANVSA